MTWSELKILFWIETKKSPRDGCQQCKYCMVQVDNWYMRNKKSDEFCSIYSIGMYSIHDCCKEFRRGYSLIMCGWSQKQKWYICISQVDSTKNCRLLDCESKIYLLCEVDYFMNQYVWCNKSSKYELRKYALTDSSIQIDSLFSHW